MKKLLLFGLLVLFLLSMTVYAFSVELRVGAAAWMHKKFPLAEAAKRFEKNHPGVKVKLLKIPEFTQTMLLKMKRGKTDYDLLMPYSGGAGMVPFAKMGVIVPLDDMFNNEKYKTDGKKLQKDDFFKGFLKDSYYEGKFYSMPVFGEIEMIALRKDLFDKAGIPIPKTWDELRDAAIKLTSSDMWGYSTCWARITLLKVIFSAVKGRGGRVLDEKGNLSFNDPITREAIKWFVDLRNKDKAMQPNIHEEFNNSRDEWKKGKVAIFHNWLSWGIEGAKLIGEDKVEYIPVPGTSKNGTMIYMGGVIVPKAGHVELAKLFIAEEIEAKWFQQWSFNHYGKNPVRRQNIEGLKLKVNWDDVIGAIDNGETLPVYEDLLKMSDTAVKYLTLALTGKMDVDSACDKIYKEISTMKK